MKAVKDIMKIAVIGGGAAGFFGAIRIKELLPQASVTLFEKTSKLLSKVRVSGGGRCNVTHACFQNSELIKNYARGEKELRSVFHLFSTEDTVAWFKKHNVQLKTEADGRMFPLSNTSETIVNVLYDTAIKAGVHIQIQAQLKSLKPLQTGFELEINNDILQFDKVLLTTGGFTKLEHYHWLQSIGQAIIEPVPSLFTFNIHDKLLQSLAGISLPAEVSVKEKKLKTAGPVLFTHWGLSGPAILKLSAFGARFFHEKEYLFNIFINWLPQFFENEVKDQLEDWKNTHPKKIIISQNIFDVPQRFWLWILSRSEINHEKRLADLSKKELIKLINSLTACELMVKGKSTFKEEFVTAGGVDLKGINMQTMESKTIKGLYFAGELLNIDGITGGFNFQAAWSTSWIAGTHIAQINE